MGLEDPGTNGREWDPPLNGHSAALQPHELAEFCESTLSCETSDEGTPHNDRRMEHEIDPALDLHNPLYDASNSRLPVTSQAPTTTQATERGQRPSAANSGDRIEGSRQYEDLPRSEQSNEVMPSVRYSARFYSVYIVDIHILTC